MWPSWSRRTYREKEHEVSLGWNELVTCIIQFQIAVDDSSFVQKVERQTDFGCIETGMLLRKSALGLHVKHQVAAADEFDYEEQAMGKETT